MLPENPTFFIRGEDGEEYGPVDLAELRDWVQENRAGLGTEVKRDEPGARWAPWQNYPELVALLAEVNATASAPGQTAPMGRRMLAFLLDYFLASILSTPPLYVFKALIGVPDLEQRVFTNMFESDQPLSPDMVHHWVIFQLIAQTILVLYFACFIAAHGQTPGKALFRLRVITEDGQKPHFVKSLLRALAMAFSIDLLFLPMFYAFFNPQRRAFHDIVARTYVVEA